jgi:hypothetical protein
MEVHIRASLRGGAARAAAPRERNVRGNGGKQGDHDLVDPPRQLGGYCPEAAALASALSATSERTTFRPTDNPDYHPLKHQRHHYIAPRRA